MFKRRKLGKAGARVTSKELQSKVENESGIGENHVKAETKSSLSTIDTDPHLDDSSTKGESGSSNSDTGKELDTKQLQESQTKPKDPTLKNLTRKTPTIFQDLQPNICKEYHKTGYCGYGDSCKFAHIRDLHPAKNPVSDPSPSKEINTNCAICENPPTKPATTRCGHRFCMQCFLEAKPKKCPVCHVETNGAISIESKTVTTKP